MAEITKISVKETNGVRKICVWMDNGDNIVVVESDEHRATLARWTNGEIDDNELIEAFDGEIATREVAKTVNFKLERINSHITTDGIHVYYDGDSFEHIRLDASLENHLVKLLTERDTPEGKRDLESWAAFAVNLYANVTPYIREQLVCWMKAQDWLSFTSDGCLIGYRGGQINETTGIAESVHKGPAIVNDEMVNGHVPNPDGAIVEMPRASVVDDRSLGCESGLHVGTFEYAVGWAPSNGAVMRVKVDPKDIVSVPVDCEAQKIRCCRFEVLDHANKTDINFQETIQGWGEDWTYPEDDDFDDDYDDYDEWDDEDEDWDNETDWKDEEGWRDTWDGKYDEWGAPIEDWDEPVDEMQDATDAVDADDAPFPMWPGHTVGEVKKMVADAEKLAAAIATAAAAEAE